MTQPIETLNRSRRAMPASPLLIAAACILSSFAARAESASAPAASAATPASASDSSDDTASSTASTDGTFSTRGQLQHASLNVDTDLQADPGPPGPGPGDDAPAPPPPPPNWRPRRRPARTQRDARAGLIFGGGIGGAQQYLSGAGHSGGLDTNLRFGYGFNDHVQMFFELGGTQSDQNANQALAMWHLRAHIQTVLIGDRRGNGLNLNLGVGFGGVTTQGYENEHDSSQVGVSFGGGLSFEGRITPHIALAPEAFVSWQQVPNYNNLPSDIAWSIGGRLNFIWYSPL